MIFKEGFYIGKCFGKWTILKYKGHSIQKNGWVGSRLFLCKCNCGNQKIIALNNLKSKQTTQCQLCSVTKHGYSKHTLYPTWNGMIQRCLNPKNPSYRDYGGRGIKVCKRWLNSFENFYKDMGERPHGKSVDRKNVDGNYTPLNCSWQNQKHQSNNLRISYLLTAARLAQITNLSRERIRQLSKHSLKPFIESNLKLNGKTRIFFKKEAILFLNKK